MVLDIHILDVNKINVDGLLNSSLLSDDDRTSLLSYKNELVRKEKTASLFLKRKYVGDFIVDEHGKPIKEGLFFNISHSHGLVVFVSNEKYPIGIDVELVRKAETKLVDYVLNDLEKKTVKTDRDFYNLWTSKESLLKATCVGISKRLKEVPALPLNGKKIFEDRTFNSKTFDYDGYVITITLKSDEDIEYKIIEERL